MKRGKWENGWGGDRREQTWKDRGREKLERQLKLEMVGESLRLVRNVGQEKFLEIYESILS